MSNQCGQIRRLRFSGALEICVDSIPSGEGTQGAFALQSESEGREMLCSLLFAHLEKRQCVLQAAL